MKSVTFEVIDGIKIVRAIGEPTIDPELTRREIRERLERSDDYKAFSRAYLVCSGLVDASPSEIEAAKLQLLEGSIRSSSSGTPSPKRAGSIVTRPRPSVCLPHRAPHHNRTAADVSHLWR